MRIVHFAVAALLSVGSAAVAGEPVVAAPVYTPVASVEKSDVVKVHYRDHHRHWRHSWRHERRDWRHDPYAYERSYYYRPWRAERRWRERHYWRHHHRPHHYLQFRIDL
ncbi:hypothetical protein N2599_10180 [Rhizobium sullae]|uniref:Uncharacterized protein n=1 Tax=Rhizobium sullae TaxID=50338 RepID=A0A2N0D4H8_RHISU|nr:hypothetical protein [Rhizobium sullae]PKA41015.1 hypothetical protein CWR43_22475 [Rhizobium sullae]UWU16313.1 hypothetical protein N2599_10180 [Rhizobium sullae]